MKFYWDIFVIVLAVINTIYLPYIFAFDLPEDTVNMFNYLTLVVNFFFLLDIIIIFRTTFINSTTGDEIWSPAMIAMNYI